MRKAGLPAVPAVAGAYVPPEAREIALAEHVVFEDRRTLFWEEMLQFYSITGAPEPVS